MKKRKKICFVVSTIFSAKVFLKNHISALNQYYDIYIVANFISEEEYSILNTLDVKGYHCVKIVRGISVVNDCRAIVNLTRYFYRMRFDAIHSLTPKAGLIGQVSGWLSKIKFRIHIFTGQVWCNMTGMRRKLLVSIDKLIVNLSTHILVDGISQKEYLIQSKVVSESKASVFGQGSIAGVEIDKFSFSSTIRKAERDQYGIPEESIVFSFLGRLNRDKGIPELLQAFSELYNNRNNVVLILFGPDEENMIDTFKNYKNLVPNKNLIYAGQTSTPITSLQVSDVFCLPSHREGFGMSVIEAEALGLPVICSDAYGLRDTIISSKTGLRHKVGNYQSLLDAMIFMIDNPSARVEMGLNGRQYVEDNFMSDEITKHWVNFYKSILK